MLSLNITKFPTKKLFFNNFPSYSKFIGQNYQKTAKKGHLMK